MDSDSSHGGPSGTLINRPPSSFGIELNGKINSRPFIKVKHNADAEEIVKYVMRAWYLSIPSLIISVTGGAQDFNLKKENYTTVRRGLGKLICAEGTWFISEGTNCGVMKLCGEAARMQKYNSGVTNLGLGPLIGIASSRKIPELRNLKAGENDDFHIERGVGLDPNHTHFIFVDDEEEEDGSGSSSFLLEQFRGKFEKNLNQGNWISVPLVLIVVQGGLETLVAVKHALSAGVPCAVIKGTLGTADLLASIRFNNLENLKAPFGRNTEEIMKSIWRNKSGMKMIPLHDSDNEYVGNIDTAILQILAQDPVCKKNHIMQLEFAFRWNRVDMLEEILENLKRQYDPVNKKDQIMQLKFALDWNRVDMLAECLENLKRQDEEGEIMVKIFRIFIESLECDYIDFVRILYDFLKRDGVLEPWVSNHAFAGHGVGIQKSPSLERMRDRAKIPVPLNLFLDSIAYGRLETSEIFWKELETGRIAAALFGGIIAKELQLEESHSFCETKAVELLTICHKTSALNTEQLLKKPNLEFNGLSCLKLAERAKTKKFIAHSACQGLIERTWKFGKGDSKRGLKVFLVNPRNVWFLDVISSVCFLALFCWMCIENLSSDISWQEGTVWMYVVCQTLEELRQFVNMPGSSIYDKIKAYIDNWWNFVDILAILLITVAFVLRFCNSDCRQWAHVLYVASLQIYFIRLTSFFSVDDYLGPKLVMITKMLKDLSYFSIIALVYIVGYGVAVKALVFPGTGHPPLSYIWSLLFRPYFEMLGEHDVEQITDCKEPPWPYETCPVDNARIIAVAIFFKALFMFFTNVLLLNLLIAIFNNRYQEVERESEIHWKYEKYRVVTEYEERHYFPPPLTVFIYPWELLSWLNKMRKKCNNAVEDIGPDSHNPKLRDANGKDHTSNSESKALLDWESYCFEENLVSRNKQKHDEVEERLTKLETKITSQKNLKLEEMKQEPAEEHPRGSHSEWPKRKSEQHPVRTFFQTEEGLDGDCLAETIF